MDDHHELTAGYALDALDPQERERYETHLATCESCREELASFWAVSGALAHAAAGPVPAPDLRERILAEARSERPNVVPLRPRFAVPALASVAAIAAVTAIAVGIWAAGLSRDLDTAKGELAVLGDPDAEVFESASGEASLVVTPEGDAALIVRQLPPAPDGKDYQIWVFENGVPQDAGLFERPGVAPLTRQIEPGQMIAITLEPDGGVDAPTGAPVFTASTA